MKGKVNGRLEAVMRVRVRGRRSVRRVNVVVDTGFTGAFTLPSSLIEVLGLPCVGESRAELGDGRLVSFLVYAGEIFWNGRFLPVRINAAETTPLVGMTLLAGSDLAIRIRRGGAVSITRF